MRSPRIALTLAVAGAAVLSAAPGALAAGSSGPNLTLSPAVATPGQSIMITATCTSTKPGWNPSASSQAWGSTSVTLTAVESTPGMFVGYEQLPQDGHYTGGQSWDVTATCADGSKVTASLTVKVDTAPSNPWVPDGGAATGDGASLVPAGGGAATGALAAGGAGLLGFVAWRRRGARQN